MVMANHQAAPNEQVTVVARFTTPIAWAGRCCAIEPADVKAKIDNDGTVTLTNDMPPGTISVFMLRPHESVAKVVPHARHV